MVNVFTPPVTSGRNKIQSAFKKAPSFSYFSLISYVRIKQFYLSQILVGDFICLSRLSQVV